MIKNKRGITQAKAIFLMINLVVAVVALSWMVGGDSTLLTSDWPTLLNDPGILLPNEGGQVFDYASQIPVTTAAPAVAPAPALTEPTIEALAEAPLGGGDWKPLAGIQDFLSGNLVKALGYSLVFAGLGYMIGGFIGGNADDALALAGFSGSMVYNVIKNNAFGDKITALLGEEPLGLGPIGWGIFTATIIFIAMYKKISIKIVEFECHPFEPPVGGKDCELCNKFEECSEYTCKSLGQACELVNQGTKDAKCVWVNPRDVNSPMIRMIDVLDGYKWAPDTAVRPPATGVEISQEDGTCVEAFTALEFTIETDEPSQCKIDYNLTTSYEDMSYYFGGSNLYSYNHTEQMSLPSPDSINAVAPELKNDGTYTLYTRCQDANGNFNQDVFSIRFCVNPGPDTTPPRIVDLNVPSNSPVQYNVTELDLEVYVNEPAECKWSRQDRSFDNMENLMNCNTNVWEMNNNMVYTCKTTLTNVEDRKENNYYFKCKDQPNADEGRRNVNTQSYLYTIIGTQPLNILNVGPNKTIRESTTIVPVYLTAKTDNGYDNGRAVCYYSITGDEDDYIKFSDTDDNEHEQRQDLIEGDYIYYIKCVDLGGNTDYDSTSFSVETDNTSPIVVRAYKESGELKIITSEKAECSYSHLDCNFEIDEGILMNTLDFESHNAVWKTSQNYYIRCRDEYENQPPLNTGSVGCSVVIRPYQLSDSGVIEL